MRAAATAASHPACPAPTTTTSYFSVNPGNISWPAAGERAMQAFSRSNDLRFSFGILSRLERDLGAPPVRQAVIEFACRSQAARRTGAEAASRQETATSSRAVLHVELPLRN